MIVYSFPPVQVRKDLTLVLSLGPQRTTMTIYPTTIFVRTFPFSSFPMYLISYWTPESLMLMTEIIKVTIKKVIVIRLSIPTKEYFWQTIPFPSYCFNRSILDFYRLTFTPRTYVRTVNFVGYFWWWLSPLWLLYVRLVLESSHLLSSLFLLLTLGSLFLHFHSYK